VRWTNVPLSIHNASQRGGRPLAACNPLAHALTATAFANYRTLLINFVNCR